MAKNTGEDHRIGSIKDRTQLQNPTNHNWIKRDTETGRFMDQSDHPFKGVAKEPDHRRTKKDD